jgi:hypothetical protein
MTYLRLFLLAIVATCASQAWAFACNSYPDHNSIDIHGVIGQKDTPLIPRCPNGTINPNNPTTFLLSSPGGNIDKIIQFVADLQAQIQGAYELSHAIPTVVVHNQCESACVLVLSALNRMAKDGQIHLLVDRRTIIGLHGCSVHADADATDPGHYTVEGTQRYLSYWIYLGGNQAWIDAYYEQLFTSEKIREMHPNDRRLSGSRLLDYASITDTSMYR